MRILTIIIIIFYSSCKTAAITSALKNEIQDYKFENVDTLVDIGCGNAYHDKLIYESYPNMFFVLEDLQYLEYHTKKWQPEKSKRRLTIDEVRQTFKNNKSYPSIESHFKLVIGSEDSIPLPSGQFSRILCRLTLHEFKNRSKMVAEMIRILRPGGILTIAEVPSKMLGDRDPYCTNLFLTKSEIMDLFKILTFTSESVVNYPGRQLSILNFTK